MFIGLPMFASSAHESPSVIGLAQAAPAAAVRSAGPALALAAMVVLGGVGLTPGWLSDAPVPAHIQFHAAAAARPATVAEAPPPVSIEPRAVLTRARLDVVSPHRTRSAAKPSRRRAAGPRRFDWSVYERATRPQFGDPSGAAAPDGLY